MADSLETMFQNPVTALWAGQREGMDNLNARAKLAMEQENIRKAQQAYSQNELTNPLEVQKLRLLNEGYAAENPGKAATSRRQGMEADTYAATQTGLINKTNSTNEYEVLNNKIKQNDALVDLLGKGAEALKEQLPIHRHAIVYDQIEQIAGPEVRKHWEQRLNKVNGNQLPDAIGALAQHSAMGSVGMRQELAKIKAHTTSNETIAKGHDATQLAISNNRIAAAKAKQGVANIRNAIQSGKMNFEQASAAFRGAAAFEPDAEQSALYLSLADEYAKKVGEKGVAGKPNTAELGIPSNQITPFNAAPALSPEAKALYDKYKKLQK